MRLVIWCYDCEKRWEFEVTWGLTVLFDFLHRCTTCNGYTDGLEIE